MVKLLIAVLLACPLAVAQAQPLVAPVAAVSSPHSFSDMLNIALWTGSAAAMAADVVTSRRALAQPGTVEANPLARNSGALIGLKVAGVGAGIGIAYLMHKSGHHRAERVIPLIFGVPSGIAGARNAGIHQ